MNRLIYLDHNATTPLRPEALEAMLPYLKDQYGNASSLYKLGQAARKAVDRAREQAARLISAASVNEIVFTSGGSESINWAIKGAAWAAGARGKHLVTTAVEHSAVLSSCRYLESQGWQVTYVGIDSAGQVQPDQIREAIRKDTVLVSVMHANNELGTVQPVAEIGTLCRERGVLFHVDAVQTVGKTPVSVNELNCDLLSMAAHKFYGPKGVGALYLRSGTQLEAFIHGGQYERNRRAGTENVPGIAGLGAAAEFASRDMKSEEAHVRTLRDRLETALLSRIECVRLNGHPSERLFNTLNLSLEAIEGEALIAAMDLEGIAVSSGSACSSGQAGVSHVLKAIGVPLELAKGSLRLSLGRGNTLEEIDRVIEVLPKIVERLRSLSPVWGDYKKGLRKSSINL